MTLRLDSREFRIAELTNEVAGGIEKVALFFSGASPLSSPILRGTRLRFPFFVIQIPMVLAGALLPRKFPLDSAEASMYFHESFHEVRLKMPPWKLTRGSPQHHLLYEAEPH